MNCIKCNRPINPLRVKALPNTRTCVHCSDVVAVSCYQVINGKTGNHIELCHPDVASRINKLQQRHGHVSNGMKYSM